MCGEGKVILGVVKNYKNYATMIYPIHLSSNFGLHQQKLLDVSYINAEWVNMNAGDSLFAANF